MTAKGLFIFEASVAVLIIGGIGFTGWQTYKILESLNRMVSVQEESLNQMKASLLKTEQEIRKVSGSVRPNVEKWVKELEKPLLAKTGSVVRTAQKAELEAALKDFSKTLQKEDQENWDKLFAKWSKNQQAAKDRYERYDKQAQALLKAMSEGVDTDRKRALEEDKRWAALMDTLKKQGQRSDEQYREVVQQLTKEKETALNRARQLEEERNREINKLLEQAKQIEEQRKRQLAEFCAKRPESVICRDL
ncbi:MAG: hypothetical protein GTO40_07410 [Deltaproteobacteria bacterium]|nr:hypothetical protein [Deltaproteobacteria bacterium]